MLHCTFLLLSLHFGFALSVWLIGAGFFRNLALCAHFRMQSTTNAYGPQDSRTGECFQSRGGLDIQPVLVYVNNIPLFGFISYAINCLESQHFLGYCGLLTIAVDCKIDPIMRRVELNRTQKNVKTHHWFIWKYLADSSTPLNQTRACFLCAQSKELM